MEESIDPKDGDEMEQFESQGETPISHIESKESQPLKYKSIDQIYTKTSPISIV